MKLFKFIGAALTVVLLAACAGPAPEGSSLEPDVRKDIRIARVTVDTSTIGTETEGRAVSTDTVQKILLSTAEGILVGAGGGARSVDVEIGLSSVKIISAGQAMVLGGESIMKGKFRLRDTETREILVPPTEIEAGGGGWVLGGLVAAATLDDPRTELRDLSQEFSDRVMIAVFGQ